ncbi:MAG: putative dehydrogenase [Acidobacteria bacterium]|nr:putative dehydrogenase [Acidobacteriota bacterium]
MPAVQMSKNVVIVGGGIAGLAASIFLARGGRSVTIFDRRRALGGRAVTHLRTGFRFNLGPHALYRAGVGAQVYRDLGVPVVGGKVKSSGEVIYKGERYRLPAGPFSLLATGFLSARAKIEGSALLLRLWRIDPRRAGGDMTAREWLDANVSNERLREYVEALMRLATYSADTDRQSAAAALAQVRLAMRGVLYIDEGWQKLVDALHSHAVAAGVNFVTSMRIVRVEHDGAVQGVELGGLELEDRNDTQSLALPDLAGDGASGTRIPAGTVILAVDPGTASELTGGAVGVDGARAVIAACLDVGLSKLPASKPLFALGIDQPLYYSVHSAYAQLTPRNGALIHLARYRKEPATVTAELDPDGAVRRRATVSEDEQQLESLLDDLQPGWRDLLVHRRFLPSMTVTNALSEPGRPRPTVQTPIRGLYLAGDWVGSEGQLSDAALASARAAAKAILAEG